MQPNPLPNDVVETTLKAFRKLNRAWETRLTAATRRLTQDDATRLSIPEFSFSLVTLDLIGIVELLGALRRIENRVGKHAVFGLMPLERASAAWVKLLEQICANLPEKPAEALQESGMSDQEAA